MAARRTVIVLGGGVGGISAANRLRKRLSSQDRVVLVDREAQHLFQPSLLWVLTGQRTPPKIQRSMHQMLRRGIDLVRGEVTAVDPARKSVRVNGKEIVGDALIISLGAALAPEAIPGLAEGGHNLYDVNGAQAIRDALASFREGRIVVLTAAPLYRCPAAPYEAAMLVQDVIHRAGSKSQVVMYAAEPGPMGTAGPDVMKLVRAMVEGHGVEYHPEHQIVSVDSERRVLAFANGTTAEYDLLIFVPPHRVPTVLKDAGLVSPNGWVAVDRHSLATSFEGVFAIGDATGIPLASGKLLPKAGVFAHGQADVVADNLADTWAGLAPHHRFNGEGACFIETGGGRAGYGAGNFYAEPLPQMRMRSPARWWHWGKILFEQQWLHQWFRG